MQQVTGTLKKPVSVGGRAALFERKRLSNFWGNFKGIVEGDRGQMKHPLQPYFKCSVCFSV